MVKILHISTSDNKGGSGRSAYRIHTGLRNAGYYSKMLVGQKMTQDDDVDIISKDKYKLFDKICGGILNKVGLQDIYYPSTFNIVDNKWFNDSNIIQLYNIHGRYFSFTVLPKLSKTKTIVWRFSDMWPITGHCAYSYDCNKWEIGCGECSYLDEYPQLENDKTAFLWKLKKKVYEKTDDLIIIVPSLWMKNIVRRSSFFKKNRVYYIPNGIDTKNFKNTDKKNAKIKIGLNENNKTILFIANQLKEEKRKGGEYLLKALSMLPDSLKKEIVLIIIGSGDIKNESEIPVRVFKSGYICEEEKLLDLYQAADIMVLPTLAENLPNTILESMSCGTPVVAFNIGGIPEVVKHLETGYLVEYKNVSDLAKGIDLLLTDSVLSNSMGLNCRRFVENNFSLNKEIQEYINLYSYLRRN